MVNVIVQGCKNFYKELLFGKYLLLLNPSVDMPYMTLISIICVCTYVYLSCQNTNSSDVMAQNKMRNKYRICLTFATIVIRYL